MLLRRVSKRPSRKLTLIADKALQNWFRAKYPKAKCESCGRRAQVRHHFIEKSKSNNSSRITRTISSNFKALIADEFQKAVVDVLVKKTIKAAENFGCETIVLGGGVAANRLLCSQMADRASRLGIKVYFPSKNLSVDNGAMIAAAAFYNFKKVNPLKLQANPSLHF